MINIFKNMIPYWKTVLVIFVLLMVQAYCDLSLPQYTSDMIDTGIQNQGTAHILPEKITKEEFQLAELFMTPEERQQWEDSYESTQDTYTLRITDEQKLEELDETLLLPVILNQQMANMQENEFKDMIAQRMPEEMKAELPKQIQDMSAEEICQMMKMDLNIYEAEDEDGNNAFYVDARPMLQQMADAGQITQDHLLQSREPLQQMAESMGNSTLLSMGISYAVSCSRAAGVETDAVQMNYLWKQGGKMFLMALLMLCVSVGTGYLSAKAGAGIGRDLRKNIFSKVAGFSNAEMDRFSTASLITRSTNDIQQIQMVTVMLLRIVLYAPVLGIGGIYKVIQTGANMGWIIILAVLLILGFVLLLMSAAMPKFKMMQKLVDELNLVSREILTGLPVIRAFGREKKEEERFEQANCRLTKTQLFTNRVMTFMMPGMMLIMYCVTLLIVWVSAQRIDSGSMQVGAMTAFITYSMQIVMSFLMLTMMSIMLPRAGVAAERIDEVLHTQTSIHDPVQPKQLTQQKGVLKFSHVNFRYPGANEDVLKDIDFTAEPGKTTAIIGSTGCGKSTLVNLIPRFYDITSGEITLDGVDIREISKKQLRDGIGFVPQKAVLFSGTIASNLRFGRPDASENEIKQAAEIAQAAEFIEEKDRKYESHTAQGGSNVSGGQKQRLAIARAIVKKPRIFVFDDSFSALDMKTDAKLREALSSQVKDSTVIIVAQRISTILHADQILVLDDGKIAGRGTHSQLLKQCEVYQQIAHSQLSEKELAQADGKEAFA